MKAQLIACRPVRLAAFLLILFAWPRFRAESSEAGLARLDFREVVRESKDKVFPTLLFIKGVREGMEHGRKDSREVAGSGVLISACGEALTNWHVVDRARDIRCMLYDGRAFDAVLVGSDKDTDLALLRLQLPEGTPPLPYARLGDSNRATEGDFVMAMGAPWGLSRSVSIGIVSCARRYLPGRSEYSLWLQTDASISPGNSGGPLINTDGEIVGISALGVLIGGDTGFAIPSAVIADILPAMREHGSVHWTWTGLDLQPLRDFNRNVYFEWDTGVMIAGTAPESPARRAGIATGDRLLTVNGKPLVALGEEDLPDIRRLLGLLPADKPARFEFMRQAKRLEIELVPLAKGQVEGEELDCPRWDFTAKAINRFDNPDLFFHRQQGVFVYGIKRPGNAANSGLAQRDILLRIGDREINDLDDVRQAHTDALAGLPGTHRVLISVLRNGRMHQLVLDYSRDFQRK